MDPSDSLESHRKQLGLSEPDVPSTIVQAPNIESPQILTSQIPRPIILQPFNRKTQMKH